MPEPDIELANALVEDLAGQTLGEDFHAERTWLPEWDKVVELETLQIAVQPGIDPEAQAGERAVSEETWAIDFAFCRRIKLGTQAEVDALAAITGIVRERYKRATITSNAGMTFSSNGSWRYLCRFDPRTLTREKDKKTGVVAYVGGFLSILRIEFRRID